jgi:hypothetical protein
MWVKSYKGIGRLISNKTNVTSNGIDAFIDTAGKIVFGLGCAGGADGDCVYAATTTVNVVDGRWHNIILMNDKNYNVLKIFVDGQVQNIARYLSYGSNCATMNGSTELNFAACAVVNGNRTGTGLYLGAFEGQVTPLSGTFDEVAIWKKALTNSDVANIFLRGATRALFQVRSCAMANCSDATFVGPDGTTATYFSEVHNNTVPNGGTGNVKITQPTIRFSDFPSLTIAPNRYFQYQYIMESDDVLTLCSYSGGGACSPEIKSIVVGPVDHYPTSSPSVTYNTAIPFYTLQSATETATCTGVARYEISINNSTWYYWSGSAWAISNDTLAKASPLSDISSNLGTFATAVGRTALYVKVLLPSNGANQCTLDQVAFSGNASY